ncbi:hypothetical protein PRK78_006708 [Emydomyces testavorans]|uniref:Uncharacterized protein n=1 Tax=Emydomyces testavorans TaxID=2070801 RepID=A0AAF0DMM6_9EURO|nr:hypothetical protein PRK78_006708 [Emydomyces testavorans]
MHGLLYTGADLPVFSKAPIPSHIKGHKATFNYLWSQNYPGQSCQLNYAGQTAPANPLNAGRTFTDSVEIQDVEMIDVDSLDTEQNNGIMEEERPGSSTDYFSMPRPAPQNPPIYANPLSPGWQYGQLAPAPFFGMSQGPYYPNPLSPQRTEVSESLGLPLHDRPPTPMPMMRQQSFRAHELAPVPHIIEPPSQPRRNRLTRLPPPQYDERYLYPERYLKKKPKGRRGRRRQQ